MAPLKETNFGEKSYILLYFLFSFQFAMLIHTFHLRNRIWTIHAKSTCADPECFARGGPKLTTFFFFFFVVRGERIQIALKADHHRPACDTQFKWRFTGGLMIVKH